MKREYGDYIEDILDAMNKAEKFIKNTSYQDFIKDEKTIFALIRALEVIGEAAKNIPPAVRKKYPAIPWRDMAGMRDKLIHEYFGVKLELVWQTVKKQIPFLQPKFKKILRQLPKKDN